MINNNQGNILFLILIAVALFAALSYAVTKSTSGGGSADAEKAKLQAAEILNFSSGVKNAVLRMKVRGVTDANMCVKHTSWDNCSYGCTACPTNDVNLFHTQGGGISFQFPDTKFLVGDHSSSATYEEWVYSGDVRVLGIGTDAGGADSSEFLLYVPYLTKEICDEINKGLGLPYNPVPTDSFEGHLHDGTRKFGAAGNQFEANVTIGDQGTALVGVDAACVGNTSGVTPMPYFFYQVLTAR